jgi:hypothetical protein
MKTISKLFLFLFMIALCVGCEKADDDLVIETEETDDFYYVRFEAGGSRYIQTVEISLTGCDTFMTKVSGNSYSEIIGPAQKGAVATINVALSYGTDCNTSIYVSKNNGPFALKKTGGKSLSYIIDF